MTDPTTDAAKLLPCPFPWQGDDGSIQQCVDRDHCGCGENTRPQPAPPAGEPDLRRRLDEMYVIYGAAHAALSKLGVPAMNGEIVIELEERIRRLGLAARPKIGDAEVAEQIRLARQWPRDCEGVLINNLADHLETAESKLAEREAELAKADAVITAARSFVRAVEANHLTDAGSLALKFERFAAAQHLLCDAVKQYDAARQQQKASDEPTEREAE